MSKFPPFFTAPNVSREQQLRNNIEQIVNEYLNSQYDYGIEEHPNMTEQEWFDFCVPDVYDMIQGESGTLYADGICNDLKFLGNKKIREVIIEITDYECLLNK